ncbi:MAG: D-alanine--D-alanine ligase [Oscillospiraceae bacterium]|jgi:D-alanine-D-alanine ligase|nr:D-alanine--D-alanine ligase [Oscillospiraceae bacterium]
MQKQNVCVLFGGVSPEHEVSLMTAVSILENIDCDRFEVFPVGITREGKWYLYKGDVSEIPGGGWESPSLPTAVISPAHDRNLIINSGGVLSLQKLDCVFPALHGANGEDGSIQGLCAIADIPCVGPPVAASAVAMDKSVTKSVVERLGIRQAAFLHVRRHEYENDPESVLSRVGSRFTYPVFVKPSGTGSSVGISKVKSADTLRGALDEAFRYDSSLLVEEFFDGREIEVAVLGNNELTVSCCGEIIPGDEFYTYDDKYINGASADRIPAELPRDTAEEIRSRAARIYSAVGCKGLSRIDFFVHKVTNEICFNEINTLPGFTPISMYPKLLIHGGMTYPDIITRLIELSMEK